MGGPAKFSWHERDKQRHTGAGTVRDMSVEGIFVLSPVGPPLGARVEIEITRAEAGPAQLKSLIKARMKVVRIDREIEDGGASGFAAHGKVFVGRNIPKKSMTRGIRGPFIVTSHRAPTRFL